MMRERKKEENALFFLGWAVVGIIVVLYALCRICSISIAKINGPCLLRTFFGIYCPGCGGTRAISALFRGQLLESFICHPLVPYTALVCGWFLFSQTLERASKRRLKIGMHYRDIYLWIALGILGVNFIVKNLMLFVWDIDILKYYTL